MLPDALASFSFARPLWLLALPPVLALCWWLRHRAVIRSGWDAIIPERLRTWLIDSTAAPTADRRYLILVCGWVLSVLILAGPSLEAPQPRATQSYAALFVVLDVSTSMLAGDLNPSRLERAKRKIHDILSLPDGRQLALVAYAGSAHRVTPLSDDDATVRNLLDALSPSIMPADGKNVGAGLALAREQTERLPPQSTQILLVTSGVEGADLEALEEHARELGSQLAILGVGTAAGSPVALAEGGFMRDAQGRILLPRLDSQALANLARRHGSSYHALTLDNRDIERLLVDTKRQTLDDSELQIAVVDKGHWLLLLLMPLAALGARKGWLGVVLIAALVPPPAQAAWQDLWQRPDQQAAELLDKGHADEAAERFDDPAWKAWSLYQTQAYGAASDIYANLLQRDPDNPDHHFDYGTALAMEGRYEEALEAFEQALTRSPDHQAARHNRRQVEDWMKTLEAEQAEAEPEQTPDQSQQIGEQEQNQARPEPGEEPSEATQHSPSDPPPPGQPESQEANEAAPSQPGSEGDHEEAAEHSDGAGAQPNEALTRNQQEQRQALDQWLQDIPDDPAELLRRKFLYQHLQQQEAQR